MNRIYKTMIISLIGNCFLVTLKFIFGIMFNFKTLIADAMHSLSDLFVDIICIGGQKLASSDTDKEHPYGHGKIEYITSIIIGTVIMIVGLGLIVDAINSETVIPTANYIIITVIAIVIIIKYLLSKYLISNGIKYKNNILIASGNESLADVLSSVGVLITVLLSRLSNQVEIFKYADKIGCIIISLFIIRTAIIILKDNINAILGEREQDEEYINKIKEEIMGIEGVLKVDNIILIKYGSYYIASIYVSVDENRSFKEAHAIAHRVEEKLLYNNFCIGYAIVHINPYKNTSES